MKCNKALLRTKRKKYCKKCAPDANREYLKQYRRVHRAEMYEQYRSVRIDNKLQQAKKGK